MDGEKAFSTLCTPSLDELSNTNYCPSPKKAWIASHTIERLTKSVKQGVRGKHVVRQGLKVAQTVEKGTVKAGKMLTKGIDVSAKAWEVKRDENENHATAKEAL